ncbi:chorismate mutase [Patescibacteria group bacterium]
MLNPLRKKIDKIDIKIAKYLCKRYKIVKEIAYIKQKNSIPVYNKQREQQHLQEVMNCCRGSQECKDYLHDIFKNIYNQSRNIQNPKK